MRRDAGGTFHWEPPKQHWRFLLSDGNTVDVICERNDSDMSGALLELLNPGQKAKDGWQVRIVGSVRLAGQLAFGEEQT